MGNGIPILVDQAKISNYHNAIEYFKSYFAPDLNSMEVQDHKKLLAQIILFADTSITTFEDRFTYFLNIMIKIAPIALLLKMANSWIEDNRQFGVFVSLTLLINLFVGMWYHWRFKTFNLKMLLLKTGEMVAILMITYVILEMLRYTAGKNLAGEAFKVVIQVMTLMYPMSKVLKNLFILSGGKHPPEWLMKRVYDYEKDGNLSAFFLSKQEEKENKRKNKTNEHEEDNS